MSLSCPIPRAAAAILFMLLLMSASKAQSVADGAPTGLHVIWVSVPGDCILATSGAPSRVSWGHETLEACQAPLALPPPQPPSPPPSSPPPSPPPPASAAAALASAAGLASAAVRHAAALAPASSRLAPTAAIAARSPPDTERQRGVTAAPASSQVACQDDKRCWATSFTSYSGYPRCSLLTSPPTGATPKQGAIPLPLPLPVSARQPVDSRIQATRAARSR